MEHRLAERIASNRAVDFFRSDCSVVRGHLRNISKDGALLEADAGPSLNCNHVRFELCASTPGTRSRPLRGIVIHRDDQKLGIMLLDTWSDAEWNALTRPASAVSDTKVSGSRPILGLEDAASREAVGIDARICASVAWPEGVRVDGG